MSESLETRLPLLVQDLRYIQSASHVLAECLSLLSEGSEADGVRGMESVSGVAYLMGSVNLRVEEVYKVLKEEIASR